MWSAEVICDIFVLSRLWSAFLPVLLWWLPTAPEHCFHRIVLTVTIVIYIYNCCIPIVNGLWSAFLPVLHIILRVTPDWSKARHMIVIPSYCDLVNVYICCIPIVFRSLSVIIYGFASYFRLMESQLMIELKYWSLRHVVYATCSSWFSVYSPRLRLRATLVTCQ